MANWQEMMPSTRAYLMNKVLYELHHKPDHLEAYNQDADAYLTRFDLPQDLATSIKSNDVAGMYLSGVNPYLLRAHCIGVKIPEDESLAALRSLLDHEDYNDG
ncbi:subunit of meta cleavage enzyme [Maritimibacter sp. UBA3975]|uniref:subunit of meta cleavage enzyme n=1 Tax=Maritimibacter sp. UBA3975 TaxID=1946833 RepID=UPI000C091778|nr:subunit of meta cleavage enzyme [Maritimibacter sp. UBA3975]MAM61412.1 subunit of meta cleavage enzyme [Maritimibacter sp.]|tara:strand:- start:51098 stop:51406 length:309 start_codon:yes stop_codon:yes gene_type:complete